MSRRVVVVGGGIAGLDRRRTARRDARPRRRRRRAPRGAATASAASCGRRRSPAARRSTRAPTPSSPESPTARRSPSASASAGELTSPATRRAPWCGTTGCTASPTGCCSACRATSCALATSRLLSVRGKLRAAIEPLLPAGDDPGDSIGTLIRARFGDEVHERLVDALVGSIYAADTDRFSLAMVPQLAALADGQRSLLLAARRARHAAPPVERAAVPRADVAAWRRWRRQPRRAPNAAAAVIATVGGGRRRWPSTVPAGGSTTSRPTPSCWPRRPSTAPGSSPEPARSSPTCSAHADHAGVAIVTLAVPTCPSSVRGMSGYLVPKPDQRLVTAASFGSQKWAHWRGPDEIVRVSLGRDGLPVDDLDDATLVDAAVAEVGGHLGVDIAADRRARQPLAAGVPAVPTRPPRLARRRRRRDAARPVPHRGELPRHRRAGVHRRRRAHGDRCRGPSHAVTRASTPAMSFWAAFGPFPDLGRPAVRFPGVWPPRTGSSEAPGCS